MGASSRCRTLAFQAENREFRCAGVPDEHRCGPSPRPVRPCLENRSASAARAARATEPATKADDIRDVRRLPGITIRPPVKLTVCSSSPVVQIRPALKESVARERYLVAIRLNERKTRASMSELNCVLPTSESLRSLSIVLQHRTFSIPGASARTRIVVRAPQRRTARRDDRRSCVLASFTLWGGVISDPVIAAANITAITGRRTGRRDARSPSKTRAAARARHPILAGRRTSLPRCRRRPADGRPFARKRATRRFGST